MSPFADSGLEIEETGIYCALTDTPQDVEVIKDLSKNVICNEEIHKVAPPSVSSDLSKNDITCGNDEIHNVDSPSVTSGKKVTKRKLQVEKETHEVIKQVKVLDAKLNEEQQATSSILKEAADDATGKRLAERLSRLEQSVANLSTKMDLLFPCRSCLRKIYKSIDQNCLVSPKEQSSSDEMPCSKEYLEVEAPAVYEPGQEMVQPSKETLTTYAKEEKDLVALGNPKFGIYLPAQDLRRAEKTAKTAAKLALNILEFLLNAEEIRNVTVFGNRQHDKAAMDENKRNALETHIFAAYPQEKSNWEKIVVSINDKIRKMRKGIYKQL